MSGYEPLLKTYDEIDPERDGEFGPDGRRLNPETGKAYTPDEEAERLDAAHKGMDALYGFSETEAVTPTDAEIGMSSGLTTDRVIDSLGANSAELGTPTEVRVAASKLNVTSETSFADEINRETRRIDGALEGLSGSEPLSQAQIRNRVAAAALRNLLVGETGEGGNVLTQDTHERVENSNVGAVLLKNDEHIENRRLEGDAQQLNEKRGGEEHVSNDEAEKLGRQARNAGVTLEKINEALKPVEEPEMQVADEAQEAAEKDLSDEELAERFMESVANDNAEEAVKLLVRGDEKYLKDNDAEAFTEWYGNVVAHGYPEGRTTVLAMLKYMDEKSKADQEKAGKDKSDLTLAA